MLDYLLNLSPFIYAGIICWLCLVVFMVGMSVRIDQIEKREKRNFDAIVNNARRIHKLENPKPSIVRGKNGQFSKR